MQGICPSFEFNIFIRLFISLSLSPLKLCLKLVLMWLNEGKVKIEASLASSTTGYSCGVLQVLVQGFTCSMLWIVAGLVLCARLLLATPQLYSLPLASMNNSGILTEK